MCAWAKAAASCNHMLRVLRNRCATAVQIALTTLEEVFLNIAKQAEVEAAGAEATRHIEVEPGVTLNVPLSADEVEHPQTGVRYKIHWTQDEAGALAVSHVDKLSSQGAGNGAVRAAEV